MPPLIRESAGSSFRRCPRESALQTLNYDSQSVQCRAEIAGQRHRIKAIFAGIVSVATPCYSVVSAIDNRTRHALIQAIVRAVPVGAHGHLCLPPVCRNAVGLHIAGLGHVMRHEDLIVAASFNIILGIVILIQLAVVNCHAGHGQRKGYRHRACSHRQHHDHDQCCKDNFLHHSSPFLQIGQ